MSGFVIRSAANYGPYTVGHYSPGGEWWPFDDFDRPEQAEDLCSYLNGGEHPGAVTVRETDEAETARSIVQISLSWGEHTDMLYALAKDGTLWTCDSAGLLDGTRKWVQIPGLPLEEEQ